jgi:hypothetical protein
VIVLGATGFIRRGADSEKAFRAPRPEENAGEEWDLDLQNPARHVYSRYTQDVSTRVEHILSKVNVSQSTVLAPEYARLTFEASCRRVMPSRTPRDWLPHMPYVITAAIAHISADTVCAS